ncbi:unnamed protein product [Cladocopium goreaui]|uniref:Uncharacterized protein n=1 Tax=Cladocopium goreaui TaxID=2562237 RepID=A0A9P1BL24_9DINO|nr:unnamed protein product [Cladocopium goreaui]
MEAREGCLFPALSSASGRSLSRSQPSRSQPSLRAPSVLSAVSTSFVPLLAPQSRIGSAVLSQPPEPAIPRDPSQVSATPPVAPVVPKPFSRRKETSGNLAAAFLPYPASEVSSIKSGWREDYWKEPSPMFTQGLMQQDLRYSTECSQCKCVVKEAKLPPAGHISAEELEQEHRLQWLDSLIKEEEKGLRYPRYSKSQINARLFPDKMYNQHAWSHKWLPAPNLAPRHLT